VKAPVDVQREVCNGVRDSFYGPDSGKYLRVLPYNYHVAVGSGSPGWVWLSPGAEKACHPYGKFVIRLDGDRLSVGYAVEKGYSREYGEPLGHKWLDGSWSWWSVLSGLEDGMLVDAAQSARKDYGHLAVYVALSPMERENQSYVALLKDNGALLPAPTLLGIDVTAEPLLECLDLPSIGEYLATVEGDTYIDLQFLVTCDVAPDAKPLPSAANLYRNVLVHFEPWVPFKESG